MSKTPSINLLPNAKAAKALIDHRFYCRRIECRRLVLAEALLLEVSGCDGRHRQYGPPLWTAARAASGVAAILLSGIERSSILVGPFNEGIIAAFVVDKPKNGAIITQYLRRYLVPKLNPGDVGKMHGIA